MRRDPSLTRQMLLCGDGDQMANKVPAFTWIAFLDRCFRRGLEGGAALDHTEKFKG